MATLNFNRPGWRQRSPSMALTPCLHAPITGRVEAAQSSYDLEDCKQDLDQARASLRASQRRCGIAEQELTNIRRSNGILIRMVILWHNNIITTRVGPFCFLLFLWVVFLFLVLVCFGFMPRCVDRVSREVGHVCLPAVCA